jgi:hypothetical protein
LLAKLEALEELDNEKVVHHVKNLRRLIDLSLKHEEVLRHLEERETYLQNAVQHQYEDVMKYLDGTFFPWPRKEAETSEDAKPMDNRFVTEGYKPIKKTNSSSSNS